MFRVGAPEDLAKVLEAAANALDKRTKAAGLRADSKTNGSPGARIEVAIDEIRLEAAELKRRTKDEGESYQWRVIGALTGMIAALLEEHE